MSVFDFSKMAAVRHLGFVVRVWRPNHEGHLVVFITVQNLVGIDAVVLIIPVCTIMKHILRLVNYYKKYTVNYHNQHFYL